MDGKMLVAAGWLTMAFAGGVSGETARERARDQPELRVIVYSETHIPWLAAAQEIAAVLFNDAGMRLVWIRCGDSGADAVCRRPPAGNELVVRIRRHRMDRASPTCGLAFRPGHMVGSYITLFLDCLTEGSNTFRIPERIVAAYCLAHEIGHLLLPSGGHAPTGIMQAQLSLVDWERAARGGLRFRPPEKRQMLDALQRRLASREERAGVTHDGQKR